MSRRFVLDEVIRGMNEIPRLYDIAGTVGYLQSVGATAATATFVRGLINSGQLPY